mmetsp:Transcript_35318/g.72153  ORF Transcript_35318/g.72153 Transcript_35318/m.72153 type:complete len:81 (+) Transcript_35318:140-382(+)
MELNHQLKKNNSVLILFKHLSMGTSIFTSLALAANRRPVAAHYPHLCMISLPRLQRYKSITASSSSAASKTACDCFFLNE